MTVVDCVFKALADVLPDGVVAGHYADLGMTMSYGVDEATGRFFQFLGGPQGGGWGATSRADGQSATICINDGDTHNAPAEVIESKYPMVTVEEYGLREDSGGPGRHRGGLGTRMRVRMHTAARLDSWIERTSCAPWGLAGGRPGLPNGIHIERADGEPVTFPNGKVGRAEINAGDCHVVELGGGGGYGDPYERPAGRVLADVRAGYVSVASAREAYGVVVVVEEDGDSVSFRLDEPGTALLRQR
jgi:N-methylhydantoinase B